MFSRFLPVLFIFAAAVPGFAGDQKAFDKLASDYWEAQMRSEPLWASYINHPGYHDKLDDNSESGYRQREKTLKAFSVRLDALDRAPLTSEQLISLDILKLRLERELEWLSHKFYEWEVNHMDGMHSRIADVIGIAQPMGSGEDARALIRRIQAMPGYFRNMVSHLRRGSRKNLLPARVPVERVISQLEEMLKAPPEETPYFKAAARLPVALRAEYEPLILKAVKTHAYRAYREYLNFLKEETLPRARPDSRPGLFYLPNGLQAYEYQIRYHTTLDKSAEELHRIGLEELKQIHERVAAIKDRMKFKGSTFEFMKWVRENPDHYFKTREEMLETAQKLVAKTKAFLPRYFGILPKTDLVVKPIEPYKEKNDASARYYQPPDDLSRPGIYYLNTYKPETRQRFSMVSLAVHEGVPGHHMQIAIALERQNLPAFRRHGSVTAFVEGWALYAERLAEEMGLYEDDLSLLGMLSDQAWRACRLVVDTGLHAKGWSRQEAVDFMKANTMMSDEEIVSEIDRYIVIPGQALAYKAGQREISALRAELESRQGKNFDIRAFHDAVLKNGALPLPILRKQVLEI